MVSAGSVFDLKWLISLGRKIAIVVLWKTALIVCLTLVSQISAILASFLPLKVIILLGSDGIPRYIPEVLAMNGKDSLIVAFSIATLVFFIVHLIAEKLIDISSQRATDVLLKRSEKLLLYENQNDMAENAYLRFSRTISGLFLFLIGVVTLVLVYPMVGCVVLAYAALLSVMLFLLWEKSKSFRKKFDGKSQAFLKIVSSVGFFCVFGIIILDFIYSPAPGIIAAIISILLSRIMLQKFTGSLGDMIYLTKNRLKVEPLFFQRQVVQQKAEVKLEEGVLSLLDRDLINSVNLIMGELKTNWEGVSHVAWCQTGILGVFGLKVWSSLDSLFLIKIYERHRSGMAIHEATIVSENLVNLPSPEFIGTTVFNEFHCIVFQTAEYRYGNDDEIRQMPEHVRGILLGIDVPDDLVKSFSRTRPLLSQRLDPRIIYDLKRFSKDNEADSQVYLLCQILDALKRFVESLPVVFTSGDLTASSVVFNKQTGTPLVLNWGRWGVDTIGSGWRTREKRINMLGDYMRDAKLIRESLETVELVDVELVAFLSALEYKWSKQLFEDALALVPEVIERVNRSERWQEFYDPTETLA